MSLSPPNQCLKVVGNSLSHPAVSCHQHSFRASHSTSDGVLRVFARHHLGGPSPCAHVARTKPGLALLNLSI
eukprot:362292-Chlamydomonas_euryale.AAC.3